MKELQVSPKDLKRIVDNGKIIGQGFFGTVFTYKDKLIKLDRNLHNLLSANDQCFARDVIEDHYKYDDLLEDFSDLDQLSYLTKRQKYITRTKLPEGFISLKGVSQRIMGISPGIIIPYHRDHQDLELLSKQDYQRVLIILRNLLLAVKELADNKIAHEDLVVCNKKEGYNVMYKDNTPQIIDLSGQLIMAGDSFISAKEMYRQLGEIIYNFTNEEKMILPYKPAFSTFEENEELLNEYEGRIRR